MNCPSCGAALQLQDGQTSATCEFCKAVYLPEKNADGIRVFDLQVGYACPVCDVPLWHATVVRQRLLYCKTCQGSLISMPAFVIVLEALRAQRGGAVAIGPPPDPHQLDRVVNCPECHRRMDTHYYAGGGNVVIDDCSRCEWNWLDAGELMAIVYAPDHWQDSQIRIDES
jgi:LSD1 subclass zinc finger protein